jgi:sugar/nucleoside kinase (ribokinase family)
VNRKIVVCGHLCLDLFPEMAHVPLQALSSPGSLFEVGEMRFSTGGCVSNTGLALHKLGSAVQLMATIGDDAIGELTLQFIRSRDPHLTEGIRIATATGSSYTVVLSPEHVDRIFLHCTGPNANFCSADVNFSLFSAGDMFHLGYPPILPRLYLDNGIELATIMKAAQDAGMITSMDTSLPDVNSPAGKAEWQLILERSLPFIDVFVPSLEETLFMLRPSDYERWRMNDRVFLTQAYVEALADSLAEMGVAIAGIKLGEFGAFVKGASVKRLTHLPDGFLDVRQWADVSAYHPAFAVQVEGTTGAGDSAYAGLLHALASQQTPQQCVEAACAVGACNVEAIDATSGIQEWNATKQRIHTGWQTLQDLPD